MCVGGGGGGGGLGEGHWHDSERMQGAIWHCFHCESLSDGFSVYTVKLCNITSVLPQKCLHNCVRLVPYMEVPVLHICMCIMVCIICGSLHKPKRNTPNYG